MVDVLEIATELVFRLRSEASASPKAEICGLLFGDRSRIAGARACRNVHPEPARRFEVDPAALLAAHRAQREGGPTLIGCYHSHPSGDATPSSTDADAALPDGSIWLIVTETAARAWLATADGPVHGRFDALGLRVGLRAEDGSVTRASSGIYPREGSR